MGFSKDIYYTNFPDDRAHLKVLVWMLFFVECLGTVFGTHAAWKALGAGWGDLEALTKPVWSFTAFPPICGFGKVIFVHQKCVYKSHN
jgi:hypothetical protein